MDRSGRTSSFPCQPLLVDAGSPFYLPHYEGSTSELGHEGDGCSEVFRISNGSQSSHEPGD